MRLLLLLVLTTLLAGCSGDKDLMVTNRSAVRPAKLKTAPIQVFMGEERPVRPYTQVAVATASNEDLRDNVKDLQGEARKVGGDAVLVRGGVRADEDITSEGVIIVWTAAPMPTPRPSPAIRSSRKKSHHR